VKRSFRRLYNDLVETLCWATDEENKSMTKTKTAVAATLALGVATLLLSPTARAMPVDGLATATASVADGIQNVRWICGPYRCWWRPNYYAYGPGYYYGPPRFYGFGPRPFYGFGYRRWGW
jgi:hypothetical protein